MKLTDILAKQREKISFQGQWHGGEQLEPSKQALLEQKLRQAAPELKASFLQAIAEARQLFPGFQRLYQNLGEKAAQLPVEFFRVPEDSFEMKWYSHESHE